MSYELRKALESASRINKIDESDRRGTFIQFIIDEKNIPAQLSENGWVEDKDTLSQIKRRWDIAWVQIRNRYGDGEDASRTVGIIHKDPPFNFLKNVVGNPLVEDHFFDGASGGYANLR